MFPQSLKIIHIADVHRIMYGGRYQIKYSLYVRMGLFEMQILPRTVICFHRRHCQYCLYLFLLKAKNKYQTVTHNYTAAATAILIKSLRSFNKYHLSNL